MDPYMEPPGVPSPLEMVRKSRVTKVTTRVQSDIRASERYIVLYDVMVELPDGSAVKVLTSSNTSWRRVVKKAGLRLASNAAKAAAHDLRERIKAAVEAHRAAPGSAVEESKAIARAMKRDSKRMDEAKAKARKDGMAAILRLLLEVRPTLEELTDMWNRSVVADVMES